MLKIITKLQLLKASPVCDGSWLLCHMLGVEKGVRNVLDHVTHVRSEQMYQKVCI